MIEFTLNRNKNGKKSRWAKKYPRERILKRGSEKAAGWYFHNWLDDDYHHFHGDLHKFLLKNVGRPVAEVGLGVGFYVYRAQDGKEYIDPRYTTYSEYKWSSNKKLPDYVFLTKEGD